MKESTTQAEVNPEIRWLTIKDAATYSSFSERTIRRAISNGELKSTKVRAKYLFRTKWLDRWILNLGVRASKSEQKVLLDL